MVAGEIAAVRALGLTNQPKLGAGFGTWMPTNTSPGLVDYLNAYLALPLDYLDFHLLTINTVNSNNFLNNSLTIASMAAAAGKPVAISQAWASKESAGEWNVMSLDDLRARGPFSFWAPLDAYFLQTVQNLANYTQMIYAVPEFPVYLFSYQTYGGTPTNGGAANCTCTTASCSAAEIMVAENTAAAAGDSQSQFTTTAFSYYHQLVTTPDTTPPSVPANLIVTPAITQVKVTWNASADDIGVAGYDVYRCTPPASDQPCAGVWIANTTLPSFTDTPLTGNTWYTYQIQAFDLANNVSLPSQTATVQTFRSTADPATSPVATVISAQEIDVSWAPPSDSTGLEVYLVFGGTSPANLQQIGTRTSLQTSFKNLSLSPGTTYYYGIIAVEDGINSAMTVVVSATTMPLPNAPTAVTGTPTPTSVALTWQETAAPGGLPISYYQIFEGTTAGSLSKVGTATGTTYTSKSLSPGTTYYFEIVASDTGHDNSSPSDSIAVTTAPVPAPPANVSATVNSATQFTLTWTEVIPPNGLPITSYAIYCGTSPASLAKVAIRTAPPFFYTAVSPDTTYYCVIAATDSGKDVSIMSSTVQVTTPAMPAAPVNVAATPNSATQVTLTWTETVPANGLPVQTYNIFRGTSSASMAKLTSRTSAQYIDTGLAPNSAYYYSVQALDTGKDVSPMSPAAQATTFVMPAAPVNVVATANSSTQVTITWTENIPANGLPIQSYNILRGTAPAALTKITSRTSSPYIDRAVSPHTTYYYAVQAVDTGRDVSGTSSTAQATTP